MHVVLLAGPNGEEFVDSLCSTNHTVVDQRYDQLLQGAMARTNPPPVAILTFEGVRRERPAIITLSPERSG